MGTHLTFEVLDFRNRFGTWLFRIKKSKGINIRNNSVDILSLGASSTIGQGENEFSFGYHKL